MKAIGYIRVSTEDQATNGVSIAAQKDRIREWARYQGGEVAEIFSDEGISGFTLAKRPGVQAAIEEATRLKTTLVVYSLSRLARNTREALEVSERLQKAGADLVSLTENIDTTTAMGKAFFGFTAVLAELERNQIAERTQLAMDYRKAQGKRVGTIPFGFDLADDGETLRVNETEHEALGVMQSLRAAGLSLRKIGGKLEQLGFRTKTGRARWDSRVIHRLLAQGEATA